jgi:hypothetical protein
MDKVRDTSEAVERRASRRMWQRLAARGLCCSGCGGSEGVWVPRVLCPACRRPMRQGGTGAGAQR